MSGGGSKKMRSRIKNWHLAVMSDLELARLLERLKAELARRAAAAAAEKAR